MLSSSAEGDDCDSDIEGLFGEEAWIVGDFGLRLTNLKMLRSLFGLFDDIDEVASGESETAVETNDIVDW
jgi:hypothetical protein